MSKETKITCDQCGRDLTYTGNCVDYRLVLAAEGKGREHRDKPTAVTAMHIPNPQPRAAYFCGHGCLWAWVDEQRAQAEKRAAEQPTAHKIP